MANKVINKFHYLEYGRSYTSKQLADMGIHIKANSPVTTETFFGSGGYDKYVSNGHGVDQNQEESLDNSISENRGYAVGGYVSDGHGINKLDQIFKEIENDDEQDYKESWNRNPYTISSLGRLDSDDLKNQMSDIMREYFTQENDVVWFPIVSIENYEVAKSMQLFNDDDYESVINDSLPRWFKSVGLDPDNLIWTVDYHNNTDNPHLHYIFLEKVKTRDNGHLTQSQMDNLRGQFYSSAMQRARAIQLSNGDIDNLQVRKNYLDGLHKDMDSINLEVRNTVDEFLARKMDKKINNDIYELFKKIDKETNTEGKLMLNSKNMLPVKKDVLKIVDEILNHPANKPLYNQAKQIWMKLDQETKGEVLDNPNRYQINEDNRLKNNIGNSILQLKKDYDQVKNINKTFNDNDVSEERKYELEDIRISDNPGFKIVFKDEELKRQYYTLLDSYGFDDAILERKSENEYSFIINCHPNRYTRYNSEKINEYTNKSFKEFNRVLLNKLQDDPDGFDEVEDILAELQDYDDLIESQKYFDDVVIKNREQSDNQFHKEYTEKGFYNTYAAARANQYNQQANNQVDYSSISPGVIYGLSELLNVHVRADAASKQTGQLADDYWKKQEQINQYNKEKEELEKQYELTI